MHITDKYIEIHQSFLSYPNICSVVWHDNMKKIVEHLPLKWLIVFLTKNCIIIWNTVLKWIFELDNSSKDK